MYVSGRKYSRLSIARKANDDALVGLLSLHDPLGFSEAGGNLVACFRTAVSARAAHREIASRGYRGTLATDLPEGDPFEEVRAASRPFAVGGRFWICPGEAPPPPAPAGRIVLTIPASLAFGTGGHESTRLALEALEEGVESNATMLDAGTGSGILALAAAALGARRAVGFDLDADAIFLARENARRHAFGERVALYAGGVEAARGRFDVVAANLLPDEALPILAGLAARLAPRGRLILSGIPLAREAELVARVRGRRLRLLSRSRENDWSCLCLARGSS